MEERGVMWRHSMSRAVEVIGLGREGSAMVNWVMVRGRGGGKGM